MATAFAATLVYGPVVMGVKEKKARLTVQLASSHTGAGEAVDFSTAALGAFSYISEYSVGPFDAAGDQLKGVIDFVGTWSATEYAWSASTMLLVVSRDLDSGVGGGDIDFDNGDGSDLSGCNRVGITVYGW